MDGELLLLCSPSSHLQVLLDLYKERGRAQHPPSSDGGHRQLGPGQERSKKKEVQQVGSWQYYSNQIFQEAGHVW